MLVQSNPESMVLSAMLLFKFLNTSPKQAILIFSRLSQDRFFMGGCICLQDLVTVIVSFNRALYAQLAQQQFQPPRGYPLPAPNNPAFKAADLGMKLTCGFEMVMAKHTSGKIANLY